MNRGAKWKHYGKRWIKMEIRTDLIRNTKDCNVFICSICKEKVYIDEYHIHNVDGDTIRVN